MTQQREIRVLLEEDTAQFLAMARDGQQSTSVSDFINSLLRQERFRQGFPAYFKPTEPLKPQHSLQEKWMLLKSGLLPHVPRPPR